MTFLSVCTDRYVVVKQSIKALMTIINISRMYTSIYTFVLIPKTNQLHLTNTRLYNLVQLNLNSFTMNKRQCNVLHATEMSQ